MYRVRKVLGNNAILVIDENEKQESIFIGTGVGFGRRVNMLVDIDEASNVRYIQEKGIDVTSQVVKNDSVYLEIASKIISEACNAFDNFDRSILITLADHIAFAVKRMESGLVINNPFKNDIRIMFKEEYDIAKRSADIISDEINIDINEDEVSYITLHLHSARSDMKIDESLLLATIINESMSEIEGMLNIKINVDSLSYSRLLTHLKYLLLRCKMKEKLKIDMNEFTRNNFPVSYSLATGIIKRFEKQLGNVIDESEIGYLAIHIERICKDQEF